MVNSTNQFGRSVLYIAAAAGQNPGDNFTSPPQRGELHLVFDLLLVLRALLDAKADVALSGHHPSALCAGL